MYPKKNQYIDEELDALQFSKFANEVEIDAVVVDDYRLSSVWEKKVERLGFHIIVMDDRNSVSHNCSMIVDPKWTGIATSKRYKTNTPKKCLRLLGPKYVMLNDSYSFFYN